MSLFVAALFLAAEPVATAPATEPASVHKPQKEKKICKTSKVETGSRMSNRICLTQKEWDARTGSLSADEYDAVKGSVAH